MVVITTESFLLDPYPYRSVCGKIGGGVRFKTAMGTEEEEEEECGLAG